MCIVVQSLLDNASVIESMNESSLKLLEMLVGLGPRTDPFSLKVVSLSGLNQKTSVEDISLKCLIDLSSQYDFSLYLHGTESSYEIKNVFPLGKLHVLKLILTTFFTISKASCQNAMNFTSLLRYCEHLIFIDIISVDYKL